MAKVTEVRLVDDLDGGEAEGTVSFALEGKSYELELSAANRERLEKSLEEFIGSARSAGRQGHARTQQAAPARPRSAEHRAELAAIRDWARANGHEISDRGRVSGQIRQAYNVAHGISA